MRAANGPQPAGEAEETGSDGRGEAASGPQPAGEAEETGSDGRGEAARGGQPWKKFVYVEPSRRVKEILQEELYFQKEEYGIKHPAAGHLPYEQMKSVCQGKWNKRCFENCSKITDYNKKPHQKNNQPTEQQQQKRPRTFME